MKRIIVEGVDGSGKTTLIQSLIKVFPLELIRNDLEDKQSFDIWWPGVLRRIPSPIKLFIHDRFFYSELVYGPVVRGRLQPKQSTIYRVSVELSTEAMLIYCRPPVEQIIENVQNGDHMEGVQQHLLDLIDAYDELMGRLAFEYKDRFIMHNYTDDLSIRSVSQRVEMYMTGQL